MEIHILTPPYKSLKKDLYRPYRCFIRRGSPIASSPNTIYILAGEDQGASNMSVLENNLFNGSAPAEGHEHPNVSLKPFSEKKIYI